MQWILVLAVIYLAAVGAVAPRHNLDVLPGFEPEDGQSGFLVKYGKKIGLSLGASALSFAGYRFAQSILRSAKARPPSGDTEELWNTVMAIHSTQAEQKELIEQLQIEKLSQLDAISASLASLEQKLDKAVADMEAVGISTNTATQIQGLRQMQESIAEEVQRNAQNMDRLKDDTARAMQEHQDLMLRHLAVFKGDLKKLLAKRSQK